MVIVMEQLWGGDRVRTGSRGSKELGGTCRSY